MAEVDHGGARNLGEMFAVQKVGGHFPLGSLTGHDSAIDAILSILVGSLWVIFGIAFLIDRLENGYAFPGFVFEKVGAVDALLAQLGRVVQEPLEHRFDKVGDFLLLLQWGGFGSSDHSGVIVGRPNILQNSP
jgi:hypothetical protein